MNTRFTTTLVALSVAFFVATDAHAWGKKKPYTEPPPPPRPEVEAPAPLPELNPNPGSLWSDVAARRLLGLDNSARQVGDLVTIEITEQTITALDATTNTKRESSKGVSIEAMLGLETVITNAIPAMGGSIGIQGGSSGSFQGTGGTTRESTINATITCEVIDTLDNGNLRVWGFKKVKVNRETQYVVLQGIARPQDIQLDNTVTSDLLAQATIEITGTGVIAEKQGPGWFARLMDVVAPF